MHDMENRVGTSAESHPDYQTPEGRERIEKERAELKRKQHALEKAYALKSASERIRHLTRENSDLYEKLRIHEHYMKVVNRLHLDREVVGYGEDRTIKMLDAMAYEIECKEGVGSGEEALKSAAR